MNPLYGAGLGTLLLLMAVAGAVWIVRRRSPLLQRTRIIRQITSQYLADVILPDGLGGEIHLEQLLLVRQGLLILEFKDLRGNVFAGDKMEEWTVMDQNSRFTFENPLQRLEDRVTSVGLLAPGVPVDYRLVFTAPVEFPKGHPTWVTTLDGLQAEFADAAPTSDNQPHWQQIEAVAIRA